MTGSAGVVEQTGPAPAKVLRNEGEQDNSGVAGKPLYRWTDRAGVVHFTDVPPTNRPYVQADVNPERNVMQSPALPEP